MRLAAALLLVLAAAPASADVIDRSASGFTVKTVIQVAAPPDALYRALVDIGAWWDKEHTYSGDSRNMSLEPRPGGCWCEKLPNGGGVEHGRVVNIAPGSLLRLTAALGPLQDLGVTGSLTWQMAKAPQGSILTLTYVVGGYAAGGLSKLADIVDKVMTFQAHALHAYAEKNR